MEVVIGKTAGFCPGVKFAVEKANELLNENNKIYCLGEIIHNKQVIKSLEEKGMITVDSLDQIPDGETVIFRAHGEPKDVYDFAKEKSLKICDLTCGKVRLIHDKVYKKKENSFIIIFGKSTHAETIGTKGFAGKNSYIVETKDDILDAFMQFEKTGLSNVYVVSQTTLSSTYFDELSELIRKKFSKTNCVIDKTICDATEKRQAETEKLSKDFHTMIIIGGKNSSNTKELVNIAKNNCEKTFSIETADELELENFKNIDKVAIMAGASTPEKSIIEVKDKLSNIKSLEQSIN